MVIQSDFPSSVITFAVDEASLHIEGKEWRREQGMTVHFDGNGNILKIVVCETDSMSKDLIFFIRALTIMQQPRSVREVDARKA